MVSGIPTASGYEERIRFSEMEVVDRGAQPQGLIANVPQGQQLNGWDVNVAAVRHVTTKRHVRQHTHAVSALEFCVASATDFNQAIPSQSQGSRQRTHLGRPTIRRFCPLAQDSEARAAWKGITCFTA